MNQQGKRNPVITGMCSLCLYDKTNPFVATVGKDSYNFSSISTTFSRRKIT